MKKRIFGIALALLVAISTLLSVVGCGGKNKFTITFDANGGQWVGGGAIEQTVSSVDNLEMPIFEKEGHIFVGWDRVISEIKEDATVKAVWKPVMFTVTFIVSGGEYVSGDLIQSVVRGNDLVAPVYKKEGYVLIWDKKLSEVKETCTITGSWVPSEYKLSFVNKDGSPFNNMEPITVGYGQKVPDLPEGSIMGKRIFAWKQKGSLQDYVYEGQCWQYTNDIVLEPVCLDGKMIRYDYNGGEWRLNPTRVPTSGVTVVSNLEREGYVFVGWVETDKNGNVLEGATPTENLEIYSSRTKDVYLKAVWHSENYSITLTTPYGVFENGLKETTKIVTFGEPIGELPEISETDSTFIGWKYKDSIITEDTVWDIKDGSVILVAVFQTTYVFTLSLESQVTETVRVTCSLPKGTELVIKLKEGEQLILPSKSDVTVNIPASANDSRAYIFTNWFYYMNNARIIVTSGTIANADNFPNFEEVDGTIRIDLLPRVKKSST
ncbi:MAG: InlB B-repeat-containing protein [Clostridia bacterium]|nr:InlB B-repeat-containing protein [Clostridia bacterium]